MIERIKDPGTVHLYDSAMIVYDTLEGYKDNLAQYIRHCRRYVIDEHSNALEFPGTLKA